MFVIGIDPHKGSHAAVVIDRSETIVGEYALRADRRQRELLMRWADGYSPRVWAIEGASGVGALLAQQLVAAGETVVDALDSPATTANIPTGRRQYTSRTGRFDRLGSIARRAVSVRRAIRHTNVRYRPW